MTSPLLHELDPQPGRAPARLAQPLPKERVLHVHLRTNDEPQTSMCEALRALAGGDYQQLSWIGMDHDVLQREMIRLSAEFRPTLVFMQLQTPNVVHRSTLEEMRRRHGELTAVSWCGDIGRDDDWVMELAPELALYTSLDQVHNLRAKGFSAAAYLQIGYDTDRYFEEPSPGAPPAHNVVFLGQNYDDRCWTRITPHEAQLRRDVVQVLREMGVGFEVFGQGWKGARYARPPEDGAIYRRARMAVSLSLVSHYARYSSDRLIRALACGPAVLVKRFRDMESWGLSHEKNCLVWDSLEELLTLLPFLHDDQYLRGIGHEGAALARQHHTWEVRMLELVPLLEAVRGRTAEVTRPW